MLYLDAYIIQYTFRWMVQAMHGKNFSRRKWTSFLQKRAIPGASIAFQEIEVLLCNVKSGLDVLLDREEEERERLGMIYTNGFFRNLHIFFLIWERFNFCQFVKDMFKQLKQKYTSLKYFLPLICSTDLSDKMSGKYISSSFKILKVSSIL